eukprot:GHVT01062491.1.p1 GENE.GHVT01062491.1~~GHVT01062491.1.p1  ORF type:complete len:114 (-),score=16.92 GHVT01062491.1:87-428(-)
MRSLDRPNGTRVGRDLPAAPPPTYPSQGAGRTKFTNLKEAKKKGKKWQATEYAGSVSRASNFTGGTFLTANDPMPVAFTLQRPVVGPAIITGLKLENILFFLPASCCFVILRR